MHIWDLRTCTYSICGLAHMHIWDLRTCTYAICGLANTRFAEVQLFPRGCHVATTWQTRCNHVATTWKQLHFRKSRICKSAYAYVHVRKLRMCKSAQIPDVHVCTSANRVCASPQIPDVHVCTSANRVCASPQITDVHMCTSANRVCARHDSRDLPGHRRYAILFTYVAYVTVYVAINAINIYHVG